MMFFQANARDLARRELFRAQRRLVSHGCQAEYHAAMATMLRDRCERLQIVVDADDADPRITPAQIMAHMEKARS